jgi:hypothetical protein
MLQSLDFSLSASASYVIQRTSSSFYPSGASEMSPTGNQVVRVQLTSESFLDPETIRIQFTLANVGAGVSVLPKSGPWCFFSRARLLCSGTLLEDVFYANRLNEMLINVLQPANYATDERIQGYNIWTGAQNEIAPGTSYTANFKPLCFGILHSKKMWPAFAAGGGLTLELYLAPANECTDGAAGQDWKIQQLEVKCDTVLMDSALENSYKRLLLEGKSLSIGYTTFSTIFQSFAKGTPNLSVPIVKAATRIRGILASFGESNDPTEFLHPDANQLALAGGNSELYDSKVSLMVGLGAKRFPIKPIDNAAFFFENLKKALNIYSTSLGGFNIAPWKYMTTSFVAGVSMERVPGQQFSGVSSRAGDLIYLMFNGMPTSFTPPGRPTGVAGLVDRLWVTVITDQIAELSSAGCVVFD